MLVLAHIVGRARDLCRYAAKDRLRRSRTAIRGAAWRQLAVLASLAVGLALALSLIGHVGTYRQHISQAQNAAHRPAAVGDPGPFRLTPGAFAG
jgi:hypothetical protein